MNEELDAELEGIIQELGSQQAASGDRSLSANLAAEVPANEVFEEPPEPPPKWFLTSETFYKSLRRSRRWLRVLGILSILLYLLILCAVFVSMSTAEDAHASESLIVGFVAIVITVLSIVPSVYMLAYANRLQNMDFRRRAIPLSRMIKTQYQMWTVLGLYSLGFLVLGLFAFSMVVLGLSIKAGA